MRKVWATRTGRAPLRDVTWELRRGEIHALVGEHRSGKSTLAGIICGEAARDGGDLFIQGRRVGVLTPRQARNLGVSVLGQESRLIAGMSVAENIFLGCRSFRPLSGKSMLRDAAARLARLGMDTVPPALRVRDLPDGEQRMVELAKAIVDDPPILILDEMSQRFTPEEMEKVHALLREWRREGRSAIFISPTLDEALESSDRVTFMSGGGVRGTEDVAGLDRFRVLNLTVPSLASRENLRAANVELYNYKRYNENLIRNLPLGVVIIDPENRVHLINRSAADILCVEAGEAVGRNVASVLPAALAGFLEAAGGESARFAEELDIGRVTLRLTVFPLRDEEDAVLGTVLLVENITLDQRMKEYLVRVERIKSAAELAAGVAHEINNPLCVIRNYVELLKRQPASPEAPTRLAKIGNELDWIVEIVGGMLSFAKPGDNPFRPVDLVTIMREAVLLTHHRFTDRGVILEDRLPSDPIRVLGDENRLKQLFVNLLANAADVAGRVRLTAGVRDGGDVVEACVSDDGPGIPDDVKAQMFNPFFTTKTGRHNTGLGLSICQQIIDAHSGLLLVERNDGWTRFSLRFPSDPSP